MNVSASFVANHQPPEPAQLRQRALDHPAVPSQALAAVDVFAGDATGDAAPKQCRSTAPRVVHFVSVHHGGPLARPTTRALDRGDRIEQVLEDHRIVPIRAAQPCRERNTGLAATGSPFFFPRRSHYRRSPGSNRCCRPCRGSPATPGGGALKRQHRAKRAAGASRSRRCHSPSPATAVPTECRCAARTKCRSRRSGPRRVAVRLWVRWLRRQQRCDRRPQLVADLQFAHIAESSDSQLVLKDTLYNYTKSHVALRPTLVRHRNYHTS